MTEVSDPGNVSALSSEVERMIEDSGLEISRRYRHHADTRPVDTILRELVRKALGTVEADKACEAIRSQLVREHFRECPALREQARALAEVLRKLRADEWRVRVDSGPRDERDDLNAECDAALNKFASWDTSQKESR